MVMWAFQRIPDMKSVTYIQEIMDIRMITPCLVRLQSPEHRQMCRAWSSVGCEVCVPCGLRFESNSGGLSEHQLSTQHSDRASIIKRRICFLIDGCATIKPDHLSSAQLISQVR